MNKICTTIEQSKKLLELGVDVNTADMYWSMDEIPILAFPVNDVVTDWSYAQENGMLPAWSLSALLDLMPNVNGHYPELCRGKQTGQYYMWIEETFDTQMFDNPIDAAFEMICWLKENNKI